MSLIAVFVVVSLLVAAAILGTVAWAMRGYDEDEYL